MKVLIIGARGFIGAGLATYLEALGYSVWSADVAVDVESEKYIRIIDPSTDFQEIFRNFEFDVCVNCAGAASVPASLADPVKDHTLNVSLVISILDAIRANQIECKFIQLSSAAVYGNPENLPIRELNATSPISPYGVHKLHAEDICKYYFNLFGVKSTVARIFSAYGIGLQKQLFWDVYQRVKQNERLVFFGTGDETRDFINVHDVCRSIEILIRNSPFQCDVFNCANGQEVTIRHAISLLLDQLRVGIDIKFTGEVREGDPNFWEADISKIANLGYLPSVSLEEGLKSYVKWLRELK